jgi:hypothetical protein
MSDEQVEFLPFHAINEFMTAEYRLQILRETLGALRELPPELRASIDRMTRQSVQVPGFRNSAKAPAPKKARAMVEVFEKDPLLVGDILSAWSHLHPRLRQQVHQLLSERGWDLLPEEADRTELPGFLLTWPKGEDFEVLNTAYAEAYPQEQAAENDVSLMVVWLSGRLPYQMDDEQEISEDESKE